MKLTDFIQSFAALFEETDTRGFGSETKFHELEEWSSLTALSFISMVDEEYNVKLKGSAIRSSVTIGDLYNTVKSGL